MIFLIIFLCLIVLPTLDQDFRLPPFTCVTALLLFFVLFKMTKYSIKKSKPQILSLLLMLYPISLKTSLKASENASEKSEEFFLRLNKKFIINFTSFILLLLNVKKE